MVNLVHKFADLQVGDTVTLKSGSPPATLVKFVPAETPVMPAGLEGAYYKAATLNAQVMWITADGAMGQATLPVEALVGVDKKADAPKVDVRA